MYPNIAVHYDTLTLRLVPIFVNMCKPGGYSSWVNINWKALKTLEYLRFAKVVLMMETWMRQQGGPATLFKRLSLTASPSSLTA